MRAGILDQRIVIERLEEGLDEYGQAVSEWQPIASCWAAVWPLEGRELLAGAALVAEVTCRIRLRYRPGIKTTDRVVHNGTIYEIESVLDLRFKNGELVLMCRGVS